MKLKQAIFIIGIMTSGFLSCSQKKTLPTSSTFILPVFTIPDSLLAISIDNAAFYELRPIQFYEPEIEFNDSFSEWEKSKVNAVSEDIFAKRQEIIIDFSHITEESFAFPLPGARVLSRFGMRNRRPHTGIDLKVSQNDTIVAAFDGVVRMAGKSTGYGNVIVIRHYNGLETVYAHNSKHLVQSGDYVKAGTPVSISGATGRASTDHLHFEVRIGGKTFNPELIIDFDNRQLLNKCFAFIPTDEGKIEVAII